MVCISREREKLQLPIMLGVLPCQMCHRVGQCLMKSNGLLLPREESSGLMSNLTLRNSFKESYYHRLPAFRLLNAEVGLTYVENEVGFKGNSKFLLKE